MRGERFVNRQKGLGKGLEEFFAFGGVDGGIDTEVTGEDTVDITIDDGGRQSEGDTPDGGSGIVAHALQLSDLLQGVGEVSKIYDLPGRIV